MKACRCRISFKKEGFTLIELLVVIAIIAILAVVVTLTLNPAELLAQSRDSQRVSDMATVNSALNLYVEDQSSASTFSLGDPSSVYVSIPDSSSTCGNLDLPAMQSGYSYGCVPDTSSRLTDGNGWIPVDFQNITSGAPFGSLPLDPVNQTSSGLYYTYTTTGSQYELTATMESDKYRSNVTSPLADGIDVQGSDVNGTPIGQWALDEGTGTAAYDSSGNKDNGTWNGAAIGAHGHYSRGKSSKWAGIFDGNSTYLSIPAQSMAGPVSDLTLNFWIYVTSYPADGSTPVISQGNWWSNKTPFMVELFSTGQLNWVLQNGSIYENSTHFTVPTGTWVMFTGTYDGSLASIYKNGAFVTSTAFSGITNIPNTSLTIGEAQSGPCPWGCNFFDGLLNDVRIYNRALSPVEIQDIYNAEK